MFVRSVKTRPLRQLPRWLWIALFISLILQISFQLRFNTPESHLRPLSTAPSEQQLRVMSLGDPISLSKLIMLSLQAYDYQPGISIAFKDLDYAHVQSWLERALSLDPIGPYPLLSAVRVYAEVQDEDRQRQMLNFIADQFMVDPESRWPWLAQAVFVARHRLHDLPLALQYADRLAENVKSNSVPSWAKQMHIFLREDMGEVESAKILLGALLDTGQITDPHEQTFLHQRLEQLEEAKARGTPSQK